MSLSEQEKLRLDSQNLNAGPHVSYMVRRETHSSRAVTSIIVAILLLAGFIYLVIEGILGMLGKKPLLMSWSDMADNIANLPKTIILGALIALAVVLIIIGLILLAKALLPGALGRHSLEDKRVAYIVDDAVIASAVSRVTRREAGLAQGQVSTRVDRKSMTVDVTPTSGIPVDGETIKRALVPEVGRYGLKPDPKIQVHVQRSGAVSK